MKYKIIIASVITTLFLANACDEKYEPKDYDDYYNWVPIESAFFAGDKDSCTYYDYEPNIELSIHYLNNGYFEYIQPFDLTGDGINDFEIGVKGYRDSANASSNYWKTIYLNSLNKYGLFSDTIMVADSGENWYGSHSENVLAAFLYGDTLTNYWYSWANSQVVYNNNGEYAQLIETGYNYEENSFDTCCGLWDNLGEDRYIGFLKIDSDTTLGWMRLEMQAESDQIILKDCAIQKFSEKRKF